MKNRVITYKNSMTEELTQTRIYIKTPLNHSNNTGLPLINLDWGSTNLPLRCVEERVMERVWASHGNPGSCGSYTGLISKNTIGEVSRGVLNHLNCRGEVYYGGFGASHWLRKIPEYHPEGHLVLIQREVHDALVSPWRHVHRYETRCMDQLTWIRRMCKKYDPQTLFLGIALSSHLTGTSFEDNVGIIDFCHELGMKVIIDATCYLAHHQKPKIPYFDYLVFSPHKLPGGPGSCGVMVSREPVSWGTERGSQNIPGVVRVEEAINMLRKIKEPEDVDTRISYEASA
jgi:selenocysteine lyase/cysteine desulfurase